MKTGILWVTLPSVVATDVSDELAASVSFVVQTTWLEDGR